MFSTTLVTSEYRATSLPILVSYYSMLPYTTHVTLQMYVSTTLCCTLPLSLLLLCTVLGITTTTMYCTRQYVCIYHTMLYTTCIYTTTMYHTSYYATSEYTIEYYVSVQYVCNYLDVLKYYYTHVSSEQYSQYSSSQWLSTTLYSYVC